jgi:hypothetical protein
MSECQLSKVTDSEGATARFAAPLEYIQRSVVVKALCHTPEGRGFESRCGE